MKLKNISNKNKYYFSLITTLIFQISIVSILPYFLFYKIEHLNGNTKSFYLDFFHIWAYCILLWSFSLFGLLTNLINIPIKNNRHIIHAGLVIFSSIPSLVLTWPSILLFYGNNNINEQDDLNEIQINEKILKVGKLGLLIINLLSLGMITMMYTLPYILSLITDGSLNNVKYDKESVVTTIVIGIFVVFNLTMILISFILKNNTFDKFFIYIVIFTSFLPVILGSIFAIVMLVGFRKNILFKKVSEKNEIIEVI